MLTARSVFTRFSDHLLLGGRLLSASLFISSAIQMLMNPEATISYISAHGLPLASVAYGATVATLVSGGLSMLLGWKTPLGAMMLGLFVILTAVVFHHDLGSVPARQQFFSNLAIAGGLFSFTVTGAGRFSMDSTGAATTPLSQSIYTP